MAYTDKHLLLVYVFAVQLHPSSRLWVGFRSSLCFIGGSSLPVFPILDPRLKVPPQPGLSYSLVAKSKNKRAGGNFWCLRTWHMSHLLTCCWCDQVMWPRAKSTGQERERWFWTASQSSRMLMRHFSLHMSDIELLIFPSKPAPPAFLPFQLVASPVAWTKILGIVPDSSFSCSISNVLENPVDLAIKLCFGIQSPHTTQCYCLVCDRILLSSLEGLLNFILPFLY